MRRISILIAALAFAQTATAVSDGDRTQIYREFRELFDAHKYEEARPVAEKLVALTEEQYDKDNGALVNPLCNLATTVYRLKDYETAEKNFTRSIEILEATAGAADRRLLRPLHGLGATYIAMKQYESAIAPLRRAVDLSRNLDGLFNADQLQYLNPLIETYAALDSVTDADKEQQYALRVAENAYGKTDIRMLEPIDRYARWLESVDRYASARELHGRALGIAMQSAGKDSIRTVAPLQGLARTYRLEFLNGAETAPESNEDSFAGSNSFRPDLSNGQRLNPDGERALKQALQAIDKAQPLDHQLRGATLMELGDVYLSSGGKAFETYREAWKELAQVNATQPLETPQLIAYRGPSSSVKRSTLDPEDAQLHFVELRFNVLKDGRTANIATASSDSPEAIQKAVTSAVKKARYRPRFEKGEAVETQGVTFREKLLLRKPKNKDSGN
jgi:tetratricopeptide (TPR) repeat protein